MVYHPSSSPRSTPSQFDLTDNNTNNQDTNVYGDVYSSIDCESASDMTDRYVTTTKTQTGRDELIKAAFSDWAFETLAMSDTACALIEEACAYKWALSLSDDIDQGFILDVADATITLGFEAVSTASPKTHHYVWNKTLALLVKALRDVWHEVRHGGFDETYGPDDVLFLSRLRGADLDVVTVLIAWELKAAGYNGLWKYLLSGEEQDMAATFLYVSEQFALSTKERKAGYVAPKPIQQRNSALQACFNAWFQNEHRVSRIDHETLEYMDAIVAEHNAYGISGDVFGGVRLTHQDIEFLSCLPDKTAYLMGHGRDIQQDPYFVGLNDEYNQAHYMQIMHDCMSVHVEGVSFRSPALAARIFPND